MGSPENQFQIHFLKPKVLPEVLCTKATRSLECINFDQKRDPDQNIVQFSWLIANPIQGHLDLYASPTVAKWRNCKAENMEQRLQKKLANSVRRSKYLVPPSWGNSSKKQSIQELHRKNTRYCLSKYLSPYKFMKNLELGSRSETQLSNDLTKCKQIYSASIYLYTRNQLSRKTGIRHAPRDGFFFLLQTVLLCLLSYLL